jgi:hypothetical protein
MLALGIFTEIIALCSSLQGGDRVGCVIGEVARTGALSCCVDSEQIPTCPLWPGAHSIEPPGVGLMKYRWHSQVVLLYVASVWREDL